MGGGGWAGGSQGSLTVLGSSGNGVLAGTEGSVVGSTDTGHTIGNGSFAMNPDGTINSTLWQDFAERSLHELALKTKALTAAYYLQAQKFAYWDGCSTGGRQGYKIIQNHADDYNGYLVGAPAFNWTKFITAELYPQIVYQRDLGGVALTTAQQAAGERQGSERVRRRRRPAPRLHPRSASSARTTRRATRRRCAPARSAPAASSAPTRRRPA